jgi:hypothetical protein
METKLIELQCDSVIKEQFNDVGTPTFYTYMAIDFQKTDLVAKFGRCSVAHIYVKQLCSLVKQDRRYGTSQLTHTHQYS